MHREFPHMRRFRILLAIVFVAASVAAPLAHAQTTLPASTTSSPWNNTATLATGTGLTINLGLGVEYLIVGGGGGGGGAMGGGGGGGGVLTGTTTLTGSTQVVVGAGGGGGYGPTRYGAGFDGSNSSLGTGLIAVGGGKGGTITLNSPQASGTGGSGGGGGGWNDSRGNGSAGTAGQGSAGGNGSSARAGGGGGAGGIGMSGSAASNAGKGGDGIASSITGTSVLYGAGGGGGANGGTPGAGGAGGGGSGVSTFTKAGDATAGTGSGGGGSGYTDPGVFVSTDMYGGSGGSGVVIVRYQSATRLASGGSASGTTGPYWWERFTTTGTSTLSFTFNANSLLATQSGAISGTGGLTYNSGGTLELTAANTFSGPTRAQSGLLNLGDVNALQNSTLDMNGSDSGTIGFTAAGTNTYTLGGLQGSRSLASAANALSVGGNGASTTYSGGLSSTGSLTKTGTGTLTLSGSNSISGGAAINAGTLALGAAGALGTTGTISFGGGSLQYSASNTTDYSGRFSSAAGQQVAIDTNGQSVSFATALTSSGGSLTKSGLGTLTLTAANTFSGTTRVQAGGISLANVDALQNSTLDMNGSDSGTVGFGVAGTNTYTLGGLQGSRNLALGANSLAVGGNGASTTYSGTLSGGGGLTKTGTGTTTLSGTNNYSGGTTVSAGRLVGTTSSLQGAITNDAAVEFAQATTGTYAGAMSGSGALVKTAAGTLALTGNNSFTGGSTIAAGVLGLGSADALGATGTISFGGGTLQYSAANTTDYSGRFSTAAGQLYAIDTNGQNVSLATALTSSGGSLTKSGLGTLTLSGSNSYSGGTVVSAGRLVGTTDSLQGGITNAAAVEFAQTTSGSYAGNMSGSGSLTKTGAGAVTLSGNNSFSGGTTISAGTLAVGSANALGTTGTISFGGGTLQYSAANTTDYSARFSTAASQAYAIDTNGQNASFATALTSSGGSLTKSGLGTLTLTAANTYSGPTTIAAGTLQVGNGGATGELGGTGSVTNDGVLAINRSNAFSFARAITGSGAFHQLGGGTTTLAGSNSYSGGTALTAGTLRAQHASALGTGGLTQASGASTLAIDVAVTIANDMSLFNVRFDQNATLTGGLTLNGATFNVPTGVAATASGMVSGVGGLTKTGVGLLTLSGSNAFAGDTALTAGTLVLANANALGTSRVLAMQPGTTLTLNQRTYVGDLDQFGGTIDGVGELVTTLFRTSSGTIAAAIADADGGIARGIRKISSGTTTVTTANTFTGAARLEAGTLALGSGGSFAAGSSAELFTGATLDLAGQSQTFSGVSGAGGTIALGAGTLTVNAAVANTFAGVITGSGGLTKQGGGDFVLSGTSTYTGATSVAGGRLSVNGVLGTTPIAVLASAELGGSGIIGGPVSIASGGTLSPGNSIQSLATGAATFAAGGIFDYEVDSTDLGALGTAADLLVVSGNLDIASGTLLSFTDLAATTQPFVEDTTIFAMINYSGSWNGGLFTYNGTALTDGSRFTVGTQQWEIDYNASAGGLNFTGDYLPSSNFVAITAVPEPSTLVLMAIGAALAVMASRRQRV